MDGPRGRINRVYYEEAMNYIGTVLQRDLEPAKRSAMEYVQWAGISVSDAKVADLGCHIGYRTFGLMWSLDAVECVGVDNDDIINYQTRSYFDTLRLHVQKCLSLAPHMQDADLTWWQSEVPDILKEGRFPRFIQADITRHTGLEPDFDLVHCNRVLCHILGGDQSESSSPNVEGLKSAIEEMARLVKSGGWVLAVEPQIQEYEYLFKDAGLEQVARFEEDDGKVRYLYTRS